jgi:parallel beta-helix repeat protein
MDIFANPRTLEFENLEITNGGIGVAVVDPTSNPVVAIIGCTVTNGTIVEVQDPGLSWLDGAQATQVNGNSVIGGGTYGISVTPYQSGVGYGRVSIIGNTVMFSQTGILVAVSHSRVTENVTSSNSADGILVADSVGDYNLNDHLENNQANGNGSCGIRFGSESGHTFRGNNVRGTEF